MRKFSKILTVLLTLALLCGVILSVVAQAEEVSGRDALNVTKNEANVYNDFSTKTTGGSYGSPSSSVGSNVHPGKWTYVDGHLRWSKNLANTNTVNSNTPSPTINLTGWAKSSASYLKGNLADYDYAVIDMDFGTDRWRYSTGTDEAGLPKYVTVENYDDIPADYVDTAELAYVPWNLGVGVRTTADRDANERDDDAATYPDSVKEYNLITSAKSTWIKLVQVDGVWVIDFDGNQVPLSNQVDVYDHFTWVLTVTKTSEGTADDPATEADEYDSPDYSVVAHFYINGEYVGTSQSASGEIVALTRLYFSFLAPDGIGLTDAKNLDMYSIAMDNLALNFYEDGYESKDAYGIDDLIKDGPSSNNIAACDDVVFTTDYVIPGKPYSVTLNGKSYYSFALACADMNNGDTINLNNSVSDFTPSSALTNFTVVCAEGATFSLSEEGAKCYDVLKNGNTYTVIINEDALANRNRLNVTNHEKNHYEDFSTATQEGGNYGKMKPNNSKAADCVTNEHVFGADGNGYWHIVNKSSTAQNTSGAEMQWEQTGSFTSAAPHMEDYADYAVIDFEFGTDRYVYVDSDNVYHTAASLEAIPAEYRDSADLAFMNGGKVFGIQARAQYPKSATEVKTQELNVGYSYTVKDVNGDWYLSADGTYSSNDVKLAGELGEFDHFTYVIQINRTTSTGRHVTSDGTVVESGEYENLNTSKWYLFVNGEYFSSGSIYTTAHSNFYFQAIKLTLDNGNKQVDKYAFAYDNMATNYYAKGYKSTGYGIDDLITSGDYTTKAIYECSDVLYTEDYISPKGYVSVDGGKSIAFLERKIEAELAKLADGATLITSRNVYDFTPAKGVKRFTVELVRGAEFTLSADAIANLWVIEAVDADTITVKQLDTSSALTVNFLDQNGKVFKTKYLLPGMTLSTEDVTALVQNLYDVKTGAVKNVTGWKLNFESGDVEANGYKLESLEGMPEVVTVTPTLTTVGTLATYAIYYVDDNGLTKLYDNYDSYPAADEFFDSTITAVSNVIKGSVVDSLKNAVAAAPDGATLVLLYEGSADIGNKSGIAVSANKTFNVDINGRTLIQSYGATSQWGNQIFSIGTGTTFNLYSSKAGGAIYQARYKTSFKAVFAQGIIVVNTSSEATVNVDGSNLSVYGGTLVTAGNAITYAESAKVTNPETGKEETVYTPVSGADVKIAERKASVGDGKQITINVTGGSYYHGLRSGYALFTIYCPDVYINVDGAKIVNTQTTYAIYHDYSDSTTIFYGAQSTVNFKNSEIICMNDEGTALTTFAYRMGAIEVEEDKFVATTISLENCKLIAKAGSMASDARLIIGAGCEVSGISLDSKVVVKDGVDFARSTVDTLSATVTYPRLLTAPTADPAPVIQVGDTDVWYLNPAFYTGTSLWAIDATRSNVGYVTTIAADVAEAKTITWLDKDGEVYTVEKWFEGSSVASKKSSEIIDGNWYDVQYKYDKIVVRGDATLTPVAGDMITNGSIEGKLANATLSSGMALNIYLPKEDGVTITEVKVGDVVLPVTEVTLKIDGENKVYYMFSWASAAADFSVATATISYSVNSEEYGYVNKTATATVELDVVLYATIVSNTYPHESEEAILVVTMMEYKRAVARALAAATETTYEDTEATKEFFASHNNCYCSEVSIDYPEEEYNDISDLEEAGIEGATFTLDSAGTISLVFTADSADLEITVKYSDLRRVYTLTAKYNEDAECYITPGVPAAYIDNIFTISVGDAVGVYSLAAYLDEAEDDDAIMVAEALYKYAAAAEAYKYITVDEAE